MSGPPLGQIFSLGERPAQGLYAAAWLAAAIGFGLIGVALATTLAGNPTGGGLFAALGFLAFFGAAVLGSGYQGIARRADRPPGRYRGPSPFLVFGAVFAATNVVAFGVALLGVDLSQAVGMRALISVAVVVPLYAFLVWFLVVREGALSWGEMGWPTLPLGAGAAVADGIGRLRPVAYGVGFALPAYVVTGVLAVALTSLLGATPPPILPIPVSPSEWVIDIVVAVILAPLGEELFFRGFAQTAWKRDLGWRAALVRAALFFVFVHALSASGQDLSEALRVVLVAGFVRLPVSFALGWVFQRSGSILASLGLHAAFNGLTLLFAALASTARP